MKKSTIADKSELRQYVIGLRNNLYYLLNKCKIVNYALHADLWVDWVVIRNNPNMHYLNAYAIFRKNRERYLLYKGVAHHPNNIENYLGFSLLTRKRHALFKDKAPALSEGDIVAADYRIINSRSSFDAFVKKFGPPDAVIGVY